MNKQDNTADILILGEPNVENGVDNKTAMPQAPVRIQLPAMLPENERSEHRRHLTALSAEKRKERLPQLKKKWDANKDQRQARNPDAQPPHFFEKGKFVSRAKLAMKEERKISALSKLKDEYKMCEIMARVRTQATGIDHVTCVYKGVPTALNYRYDENNPYFDDWLHATRFSVEPLDSKKLKIDLDAMPKSVTFELDKDNNYLPVEMVGHDGQTTLLSGYETINAERKLKVRADTKKAEEKAEANGKHINKDALYILSDKKEDLSDTFGNQILIGRRGVFHEELSCRLAYNAAIESNGTFNMMVFGKPKLIFRENEVVFHPNRKSYKQEISYNKSVVAIPLLTK